MAMGNSQFEDRIRLDERALCAASARAEGELIYSEIKRLAGTDRADDGTLAGRASVAFDIANKIANG